MDAALRDRWLEEAHRRIRGAGLRSGAARNAIVDALATDGQCLLTAQQVTDRVTRGAAGSTASVYRVLVQLSDLGLLERMEAGDGTTRFEIADPEHHHHHFVDERTGTVRPFTDDAVEAAIHAVAERLGVRLTGHDVILRGVATAAVD